MRKLLLLFAFVAMTFTAKSQLADGTTAPNWTLTDITGTTWTLYDVLNQGKAVALDFSATWCGPCWNYHNSGALENLYDDLGPSGSNEAMVFFIEPDVSTNLQCLYGPTGCVGGTQGNWVQGTPYPIINTTTSAMNSSYQINYYPTLYGVAPNKTIWEVGQASTATWKSWFQESFTMEVTGTVNNATCPSAGGVDLNVSSGYLTKTYQWSNGSNSQDLTGVNAGNYTVTVTDAHGYFLTKSFTVTGPSTALNVNNANVDNITCFNAGNGSITLGTAGGYPGYSYNWSNGANTGTVSNLGPGTYSVVVTDNQGCTLGESFVVEQPDLLTALTFVGNATCGSNNGTVTIESEGGTGNHFYQLGTANATTQNTFFDLAAGLYDYTVTDLNGCFYSSQFTVNSTGSPAAQAAASGAITCAVPQITVSGAGSATGSGVTYLWTTTNGNIVSGANTINAIVNAAGTYTLKVTSQGCSATKTVVVTSNTAAPTSNAGTAQPITCATTQVTLNGAASSSGANFTYAWTTANGNIVSGANTATPIVDKAGTYSLAVTNTATGCAANSTVAVAEDKLAPSVTVNNAQLTCAVNTAQLCATVAPNVNVSWNINGTAVAGLCATATGAGSFVATATGANGCATAATAVVTTAAGLPQISAPAPAQLTCVLTETIIAGELVGDPTEYTIAWTTANGTIASGASTLTPTVNDPGTYTMTAINNATQCTSTLNVTVTEVLNIPVASYTSALAAGQLSLNSTSSATGTVTWDLGGGQTATGNGVTVSFPNSGTYPICMTLTNECGTNTTCSDVQYFTVLTLVGNVTNPKCAEGTGSIAASFTGGPTTAPIVYAWSGPNGFSANTESIDNLSAGTYTCVLTDANGVTATNTFNVVAPSPIAATSAITNATNGQSNGAIDLTTSGGTGAIDVSWSNGLKGASIKGLPGGTYTATIVDANGCTKTAVYVVETISGVQDPSFVSAFSVYPNPTSSTLNFELATTASINANLAITNNVGQRVWTKSINGTNFNERIDVASFSPGIYTITVSNNDGVAQRRFIVTK